MTSATRVEVERLSQKGGLFRMSDDTKDFLKLAMSPQKATPVKPFYCPACRRSIKQSVHVCSARGTYRAAAVKAPVPIRTQKARGIKALDRSAQWHVPVHLVLGEEQDDDPQRWHLAEQMLPCFARPCPIRPRHGFVDSRRVETMEQVVHLWQEATTNDPLAELVLMQEIQAIGSAILAPGMLVLGPGNDGATSGHESLSIPLRDDLKWPAGLLRDANICEHPYLEIVFESDNQPYAVQLRDGLPIPRGRDFVPERFTVRHVVRLPPAVAERPSLL